MYILKSLVFYAFYTNWIVVCFDSLDFSRTYVIFYEFAPGLKTKLLKQICALTGYPEDIFMKAVYVNALHRLNQSDTERTRKLVELLKK